MKRSEVKKEYTWKLEDIFQDVNEWEKELSLVNKESVKIVKFKGKLGAKASLLECFQFNDGINNRIEKLYVYAMFRKDLDGVDTKANELHSKVMTVIVNTNSISSFITPELSSLDEKVLLGFIEDKNFSDYEYMLRGIIRQKKHILSEREEKLLALGGKTFGAFREIFRSINDIDMPFPTIKVEGQKVKLSHGMYSLLLQNKDADVRKKAFKGMYQAVTDLLNTTTSVFSAHINRDNFLAQVRGYSSALEKAVESNDVPVSVFNNLIENTSKNIASVHEYVDLRKKVLKVDTLHMYDLYFPMFENADISCNFEEAYDLVLEGLKPLGSEYNALLKTAKDSRWLDVEETENKRSGAYSCGVYGVHPYVLLNYKQTTHDIFTIAHEMGHALHSYYASKTQAYAKNDYAIFVAEVASTVNEVLLLKHLLKTVKDQNVKRFLLSYYLDMFRTTMFRQTMFAEFEQKVHVMEQKGEPLTIESLCKVYYALNKKYYGASVKHDKEIRYEWARIPHFYSAFYVYQYSTGIASAVNIANDILKNGESAVKRYKEFLCSGGKKSPYEILKDCGVDLNTNAPYDVAFGEFRDTLEELKKLV